MHLLSRKERECRNKQTKKKQLKEESSDTSSVIEQSPDSSSRGIHHLIHIFDLFYRN